MEFIALPFIPFAAVMAFPAAAGLAMASGVHRFVGNAGGGMAAMSEFMKQNFGIDLAHLAKSKPGEGVSSDVAAAAPLRPPIDAGAGEN